MLRIKCAVVWNGGQLPFKIKYLILASCSRRVRTYICYRRNCKLFHNYGIHNDSHHQVCIQQGQQLCNALWDHLLLLSKVLYFSYKKYNSFLKVIHRFPHLVYRLYVIKRNFFLLGFFRKTNCRFPGTMSRTIQKNDTMNEKEGLILIKESQLNNIIDQVRELQHEVLMLRNKRQPAKTIHTNDDMRELLHVNNKLLKRYRDSELLGYSYSGGKYWYTQDDVRKFLKNVKIGV